MAKKKDIIKILNSNSRDNLSGLTSDKLEIGELALITETNYERLYCKNSNGDVVPIHRIFDGGEIEMPESDFVEPKDANYADICVADASNRDSLLIIKSDKWTAEKYPIATYVPVGIVVVPASHGHYENGKCAVMSLNHMNCDTPTTGGASQYMYWGVNGTDINTLPNLDEVPYVGSNGNVGDTIIGVTGRAYLPSDYSGFTAVTNPYDEGTNYYYNDSDKYIPSPYMNDGTFNPNYSLTDSPSSTANCLSDFDGYGNTKKTLEVRGEKDYSSWTPSAGTEADYPAASCCDMYSTVGIPQGSWYLPSAGELGYVCVRRQALVNSLEKLIQSGVSSANVFASGGYWSSSEYSSANARTVTISLGIVGSDGNKDTSGYVRAFALV